MVHRGTVVAAALLAAVALFTMGSLPSVEATHFRYGHMYWERNTLFNDAVNYQILFVYESGWRRSFFGAPVAGGTINPGANVIFSTPAGATVTTFSYLPTVTAADTANDLIYVTQSLTFNFARTISPLRGQWDLCCRISTLLDGNNDQNARMSINIFAANGTKSPKTAAAPILQVTQGVVNNVFIPTVSFDNFVNRLRWAATTESTLIVAQPAGMVISSTLTNTITWTPPILAGGATGLYATQIFIQSYDANNVMRNEIPLDFIWRSVPPCTVNCVTITLSTPATTLTANVGLPISYTVTQSTTNPAGLTSKITNTPLPAGATVTSPTCAAGSATCTTTFNWTPGLSSTAAVVCYQGSATNGVQTYFSTGQVCVEVKLGALATSMTAFAASGVCGGPTKLSARLLRVADNSPIGDRTVEFAFQDSLSNILCRAQTDTTGLAQCNFFPAQPILTSRNFQATFQAIVGEFLLSSASANTVVTTGATSTLQTPVAGPASIGFDWTVYGILNRVNADGGIYPPAGSVVKFTITRPDGQQTVINGATTQITASTVQVASGATMVSQTINAGVAPITVPASFMNAAGTYTVRTEYAGDACLIGASAVQASFVAYQRIFISSTGASVTCEKPVTLTAFLNNIPQNAGLSGRTLTTSFSGPSTVTADSQSTNANGRVDISRTIVVAGTYTATFSAAFASSSEADSNGLRGASESETATITVLSAATTLAVLTGPVAFFPNNAFTFSTRLNRALAPNEAVVGASVTFSLTGASTQTKTGVTGADGSVSATFITGVTGAYNIVATYTGVGGCLASTSSNTVSFNVVSAPPTSIDSAAAVNAVCGSTASFSARVLSNGLAVSGLTLTFTQVSDGSVLCSGVSNAAGVASCTATAGNTANQFYMVNFAGSGASYPPAQAGPFAYTISAAATSLSVSTGGVTTGTVGGSVSVSATVSRTAAPAGLVSGVSVQFTFVPLAGPQAGSGQTNLQTATTDANGVATVTVSFPDRGTWNLVVNYAGSSCLGSSSSTTGFTIYQRTALVIAQPSAPLCGIAGSISATLTAVPQNTAISGQTVSFTPTATSATTSASGVASTAITFSAGANSVSASFSNVANWFADSTGALAATTASISVQVAKSDSAVTITSAPATANVGSTYTASARVDRLAPTTALSGFSLVFTLTDSQGGVRTLTGTATGSTASVTFAALTVRGPTTLSVSYAGDSCVNASPAATSAVTVNQATSTAANAATGVCGAPVTLSAVVRTLPDGVVAPAGASVSFSANGQSCTGTTDANGAASCQVTLANPFSGVYTAAYAANGNLFASSGSNNIVVSTAATALDILSVNSVDFVGNSLSVSTTLRRTAAPAGTVSGASVSFKLTGPQGPSSTVQTITGTTDGSGVVTVNFPLTVQGQFHIDVTYAGSTCLQSTTRAVDLNIYLRSFLLLNAAHGTCGDTTVVSAGLHSVPAGVNDAIVGQTVNFDFVGVVPAQSAVTNSAGVASINTNFANAGSYPMTASFFNAANFFVDAAGNPVPTVATGTVNIASAATSLSALAIAPIDFVGDAIQAVSVVTRIVTPAGPVAGVQVSFELKGATTTTLSANTDANGHVGVTFTLTEKGAFTVTARFAGTTCLLSSTASQSISVYQKTSLSVVQVPVPTLNGVATSIRATLVTVPGGLPVLGQTISFTSVQGALTATTDAQGVAAVSLTFANAGSYVVSASFSNVPGYYANRNGALASEAASATAVISKAQTQCVVSASSSGLVGAFMTVTATLSRVDAPVGFVVGETVVFTFSGAATATMSAVTVAGGVATVQFPLTAKGSVSVSVSYAGNNNLISTSSNTASFDVFQRTSVSLGSPSGIAGAGFSLSATLLNQPSGVPISGATLTFAFGGVIPDQTAVTGANGVATVTVNFAVSGTFAAAVSFSGAYYTNNAGAIPSVATVASSNLVVVKAVTSTAAVVSAVSSAVVSGSVSFSTVVTRTDAPAGAVAGALVVFSLSGPNGISLTLTGTTDAQGACSVSFPVSARGVYTVSAAYAGNDALLASNSLGSASVTVYQQTSLSSVTAAGVAGAVTVVQATLVSLPGGAVVAGQTVVASFGGLIGPIIATTDANGVATFNPVFPIAGASFTVSFSFSNAGDYFTNNAGALPPVATTTTTTVSIVTAATALSALTVSPTGLVADTLPVSVVLSRTDAPAGFVAGGAVVVTLTGPAGANSASVTATGTSNQQGEVSVNFPLVERGVYTVSASFAVTASLSASASSASTITVYQRSALVYAPASGICGGQIALSATLRALPANTLVTGADVDFDFDEVIGGIAGLTVNGVVSVSVSFPEAGSFASTARFLSVGDYWTNAAGAIPPVATEASITVAVAQAVSSFDAVVVPTARVFVADQLPVSVVLNRVDAPAGFVSSASVEFTLTRPDGSKARLSGTTNAAGLASVVFPGSDVSIMGSYSVKAAFAGGSCAAATVSASASTVVVSQHTAITFGPLSGNCAAASTLSATLTTVPQGTPVSGKSIAFTTADGQACTGTTDQNGVAECDLVFNPAATVAVNANFFGQGLFDVSAGSGSIVIGLAPVSLRYTGRVAAVVGQTAEHAVFALGSNVVLSARLRVAGTTNGLAKPLVTLTLGSGAAAQSCSGSTDAFGDVSCTITNVQQPLGPQCPIAMAFPGDDCYAANTVTANALIFAFPSGGTFSIGDLSTGATRTFLSWKWAQSNAVSGARTTSTSFIGFGLDTRDETGAPVAVPTCTGYTNAGLHAKKQLPSSVPEYLGLVRTSTTAYNPATGPGGAAGVSDPCNSSPCQAGTCVNVYGGGFWCDCPSDKWGNYCENNGTATTTQCQWRNNMLQGDCRPYEVTFNTDALVVVRVTPGGYCNGLPDLNDGTSNVQSRCTSGALVGQGQLLSTYCFSASYAPYCTYSQGGYGTACPDSQNPTKQPGCIRDACFAAAFPNGVRVGVRHFGSSQQVESYLPVGNSEQLTGQTLALLLNLGFDSVAASSNALCNSLLAGTASQQGLLAQVKFSGPGPLNGLAMRAIADGAVAMINAGQSAWTVKSRLITAQQFLDAISGFNTGQFAGNQFYECLGPAAAVDTQAPAIRVPTLGCQSATSSSGAFVSYSVSAVDNVDGSVPVTCSPATGLLFPIGATTVTCSAVDVAGNAAQTTFVINVCDNIPPVLTEDPAGSVPPGVCFEATSTAGAVVNYVTPTAGDAVTGSASVSCSPASGSAFPVGANTVHCTATDSNGNTGSLDFVINVCDSTVPVFNPAQPPNVPCVEASSPAGAIVTFPNPTVNDVADGAVVVTCSPASGSVFPVGQSTVTCNAVDASGNTAAPVTFTVDVCDSNAPAICDTPANIPCVEATSFSGAVVHYVAPTANDVVDGVTSVVCTLPSGSWFPLGLNTVVCTTIDAHGNAASATFTVRVCDTIPPTISQPPNIPCVEATSPAGAVVTYITPAASDIADANVVVTCIKASGSTFGVGTNVVVCSAADKSGNKAQSVTFTIDVCDHTPPVIHDTPQNIPCVEATSPNGAPVYFTLPTATDIVDVTVIVDCVKASGSIFAVGTNTVVCTARDQHGNSASTSFTIEVCDRTPPVIHNTPQNIPCQEATSPNGAVVSWILPTATDIVDVTTPVYCVPAPGSVFAIGTTTVVCTSTDAHGNSASTSFTVEVCDRTPPVIHNTPNDIPCQEATSPAGAVVYYTNPTATDIVDGNVIVICLPASGSTFAIGTTTVTCSTVDHFGNSASTSFTVDVCDRTPPVISQPPDVPCTEATSPAGAVVTYYLPAVVDIADPTVTVTCVRASGSTFAVGVTVVTCTATDYYGNAALPVYFNVYVCDTTPPTITNTPNDIPCQEATSPAGRTVFYNNPSSTDIVDGAVVVYCVLPSGSTFHVGISTVVCTATDAHGNAASTSFTIEVCDRTPPVIHDTPSDIPCVEATGPTGAVVTYVLPTATDIVDVTDPVTCVLASGRTFAIGVNTVVCTSCDAHQNCATTKFTITVCDRTPPTIYDTPNDIPCVEATSPQGAVVTYTNPTSIDIVDGPVTVYCILPSGSTYALGVNTVVCTATDFYGNSASTSFTITICDRTPPVIHDTPQNIPCVEATSAAGAVVTYTLPTATDIYDVTDPVTCVLASGSTFFIGLNTVTCTSCDTNRNCASTSFTIEVCDDTAPVIINTPANIPCVEATSPQGAVVTYVNPTATDVVDGTNLPVSCVPPSGFTFALDITTVTCTVTDVHGNTAQTSFTIEVCDTTPPVIPDLPANIPCVEATSAAGAVVTWVHPTALDVYDVTAPVVCTPVSGSVFPLGTSTVTCVTVDKHQNSATYTFTVQVCDRTPPVITNTPQNIPCVEATSANGAVVTFTPPGATDAVDGPTVVVCVPPSGSIFAIAITTVTCTTSDARGNSASSSFTVEVCDHNPPIISPPPSIPCVEGTSPNGTTVTYTVPNAFDVVDGTVTVTCVPPSGSVFPISVALPVLPTTPAPTSLSFQTFVTSQQLNGLLGYDDTIGFAYAGNKFVGSVYFGNSNNQMYAVDTDGSNIRKFGARIPNIQGEVYVSSSLGFGFGNRDIFLGAENRGEVWRISNDGSSTTLFASGLVGGVRAIAFDPYGRYGNAMIVATKSGYIYKISPNGSKVVLTTVGEDAEGLSFAPDRFGPYSKGTLFVASEGSGVLRYVNPDGVRGVAVTGLPSAEMISFVPLNLGLSGDSVEGFYAAAYPNNIQKAPASAFVSFLGDAIVTGEGGHQVWRVHFNAASARFEVTQLGFFPAQPEDGIFVSVDIIRGDTPSPNTVVCTATDSHGNSASVTFTVEVCDTTPPVIHNTPNDIPCVEATSAAGAVVTYTPPTATDIVDVTVPVTCSPASGSTFAVGVTTVVCVAVDVHGNSARTSFTVTICDTTPPTIHNPPANIPCVEATGANGAVVTYVPPTATDIVDGGVAVHCVPASGSTFAIGTWTVTCTASDAHGNTSQVTFTVTVCDTKPPVIVQPPNVPCVEAVAPSGSIVYYNTPSASDIVDGAVAVSCTPASGTEFAIGTTTVTCSASDAHGNSASVTFTVKVCDRTPPVICLPPSIPCVEATSPAGAAVYYPTPGVSDAADPNVAVVCTPASGSTFSIGLHTVECVAQDVYGNQAYSVHFTVEVCDKFVPVLTEAAGGSVPAGVCFEATSPAGAVVTYTQPTAVDIVGGSLTVTCVKASGSVFALGATTVVCSATDSNGNVGYLSFVVNVCDTISPVIAQPSNIPCVEATGANGAVVTFTNPAVSDASDANVQSVCVRASGSVFGIGVSTVTCTATDASGNIATPVTFTVTVCDRTAPTIVGTPANIPCREATSVYGAIVSWTAPTASDIVAGAVAVDCVRPSGSVFPLGTTTVVCTADDPYGNSVSTSFTVTVCDTTIPVIAIHANIPCVEATSPNGAVVNYDLPVVSDIANTQAITAVCLKAPGSTFPIGVTTVTCTAVDGSGNQAVSTSFTVTVCDSTCPAWTSTFTNLAATATSTAGVAVSFPFPTASDVVGPVTIDCSRLSGSVFGLGLTTVTCNAHDAAGNNCPRSFTVLVCYYGSVPNAAKTQCVPSITVGDYCTYTQGGWGAACAGNNIGCTRDRCFATTLIGDTRKTYPNKIEAPYFAEFNSASAVTGFLPAGGPAGQLATDATNPTSTAAGVLAGQVLTLSLNVEFDETSRSDANGDACAFPRTGIIALKDLEFVNPASPLHGMPVWSILAQANAFLAAGGNAGVISAAAYNDAIDKINNNFDNCSQNNGFLRIKSVA